MMGQVLVSEAMALVRTGEDELEIAVREHARLVYRIAYSVLRDHHDAEDATQETFLRVLRYRRKLAGDSRSADVAGAHCLAGGGGKAAKSSRGLAGRHGSGRSGNSLQRGQRG